MPGEINRISLKGISVPHKKTAFTTTPNVPFSLLPKMTSLPDPETLAAYNAVISNGAERIMQMAEKQQLHRIQTEWKIVAGQMRQSAIGQLLAFLIGLAALLASTYCIISGYEWAGSLLGLGGLTGLVTAFLKGKEQEQQTGKKWPQQEKEK